MSHPVLELLASEGRPQHHLFQHVSAALAKHPAYLSDLSQGDLAEELLSLLSLNDRANRFTRLLLTLGTTLATDECLDSRHITLLLQELAKPFNDLLDQNQYHDVLCAVLPLCGTNHHRWTMIKNVAHCGRSLEILSVSFKAHATLCVWSQAFNSDGLDTIVLGDWVRRLVVLIETCRGQHKVSTMVAHWRKIETLKLVLQEELESERRKSLIGPATKGSKPRQPRFDHDISSLFSELGLSVPESYRVCRNHMDTLSCNATLPVLRTLLESYPCSLCLDSLQLGPVAKNIRSIVGKDDSEFAAQDDPFDAAGNSIGQWRLVLSSRAYPNLRCFESDTKIMEALEKTLRGLAAGNAKSALLEFRNEQPTIPLRGSMPL